MSSPSVSLILSAQLPFTRLRPRGEAWSAGEIAFFRALTECYLPLFDLLLEVADRPMGKPPGVTVAVSPVLMAMLNEKGLRRRYADYLLAGIEFAEADVRRFRFDGVRAEIAHEFRHRFVRCLKRFTHDWSQDVLAPLRELSDRGIVEIAGAPATPAILPLLSGTPGWTGTQVEVGRREIEQAFGGAPRGFLVPDGAYCSELEPVLEKQNVEWIALRSMDQVSGATVTNSGLKVLWTQRDALRPLWDPNGGYAADASYLDRPGVEPADPRAPANFGITYSRAGAKSDAYRRGPARRLAAAQAHGFLDQLSAQPGPITLALPMETFGHTWSEGLFFLRELLTAESNVSWMKPGDVEPAGFAPVPALTTDGRGRTLESWVGDGTAPVFPPLFDAMEEVRSCARALAPLGTSAMPSQSRALAQMIREMLLAQSGDSLLFLQNRAGHDEVVRPMISALLRLRELLDRWKHGRLDREFLGDCFRENPLFPGLDWRTLAAAG